MAQLLDRIKAIAIQNQEGTIPNNDKEEKEGIVMKLTILIIIGALGVAIPLLWITGTLTSVVYFIHHQVGATNKEGAYAFNPHLGITMADGGDTIDKKKKR